MESKSIQDSSKVRNRKTLQHKDDYFITYMNGNFYSQFVADKVSDDLFVGRAETEIPVVPVFQAQ